MKRLSNHNDPGLIQDISYRATPSDAREGKLNHAAAIGELDDVWQRQAKTAYHGLGTLPFSGTSFSGNGRGNGGEDVEKAQPSYSPALRVPPLTLLMSDITNDIHENSYQRIRESAIAILTMVSAFIEKYWLKIQRATKNYLPKNYTLAQGTSTDWRTTFIMVGKRFGIPLAAAALLVIAAVNLPHEGTTTSSPATKGHKPTVTIRQSAANNGKTGSHSGTGKNTATHSAGSGNSNSGTSSPGTAGNQPNTTSSSYYGLPSVPSSSGGTIGGYGGGGTTSTPPSTSGTGQTTPPKTSGIPGVTTPYPVTVPGQSVDVNGKPVGSTSPTTITLN